MAEYLIELKHISKSFPGVKALDDVTFNLFPGEVHALLGENGAGKSTLMKIISGVYTRDAGEFYKSGAELPQLTPRSAQERGIAIIHQELNMCQELSVSENIFLGREIKKGILLDKAGMNQKSKEWLHEIGLDIDPNEQISKLSVGGQQMVEICKAISTNCDVLIMDEPTSALTLAEVQQLNRIILDLKAKGVGIVYITHRMEDLKGIVDRVTILRNGQYVRTDNFSDISMDEIIKSMVGREISNKFPHVDCEPGETMLHADALNAGHLVRNVSFTLRKGEILGFAGLMGAGRTELMQTLFGTRQLQSGSVYIKDKPVTIKNAEDAIAQGIVYIPEDRKKFGLCTKLSILHNISLPNLKKLKHLLGKLSRKTEVSLYKKAKEDLKIKASDCDANAEVLSGGNQQKVVVAKWLAGDADIFLFDEPTRGIDVAAKVEIYNIMNSLKQQGKGVIFVSSELPEILGMADRIIVMCDGRISGELQAHEATQEAIMKYATQFEAKKGN